MSNAFTLKQAIGSKESVIVRDGSWVGSSFLWDGATWTITDLYEQSVKVCDRIAVVSLENDADADDGLNQCCLGCDLDTGGGEWVVPAEYLSELRETYGDDLAVLWVQDPPSA